MRAQIVVLCLIATALFASTGRQLTEQAVIEGTVRDSTTGNPVSGADVWLSTGMPGKVSASTSDTQGRFVLRNLRPGRIVVQAAKSGYENKPLRFDLKGGQYLKGAVFRIRPIGNGIVTGRVFDSVGRGVPFADVTLLRSGYERLQSLYDPSGPRPLALQRVAGQKTDDRGQFRISGVPSGEYLVLIEGCQPNNTVPPAMCIPPLLGRVLYPGVRDLSSAVSVPVEAAQEIQLHDVRLLPPEGRIRVRISTDQRQEMGLRVLVRAIPQHSLTFGWPRTSFERRALAPPGLPIDLQVDFPGTYLIRAFAQPSGAPTTLALVNYMGNDTETTLLTSGDQTTGSATIRVVLEERPATQISVAKIRPFLVDTSLFRFLEFDATSNGTFANREVTDGRYSLGGFWPGTDGYENEYGSYYIVSARQGGRDVLREGVVVAEEGAPVEVSLSSLGGVVTGAVVNSKGEQVPDAVVALIPDPPLDQRSDRQYTYRTERTDQNGVFELAGIVPGSYHVYAWYESDVHDVLAAGADLDRVRRHHVAFRSIVENGAFRSREFITPFLKWASAVRVEKGNTARVSLRVIERVPIRRLPQ